MRVSALSDWKIIRRRLESVCTHKGAKWWLKDSAFAPAAESTARAVKDIMQGSVPPHAKIVKRTSFKNTERKILFAINYPETSEHTFIAKVFLGDRISKATADNGADTLRINPRYRLRCSRDSLNEVANLLRADERHINTPIVYGYGRIKGALGLAKASVIILEYLGDSTVDNLLRQTASEEERSKIFMRTIPVFVSLYNARCNHIDVNSGAIMLCEHNLNPNAFLLDFQHAKFYSKPSTEILMFEAGYFAQSCRNWISTETVDEWLGTLLTAVNIKHANNIQEMKERFYYYCKAELSRKKRKSIYVR